MPTRKPKSDAHGVARLAEMLAKTPVRGRGRHSALTRWLQAHHDEFAAMLLDKQPSWEAVAAGLAAMGVRDGAHKPPTAERVRKAWWEVRQHAAARQSGRTETPGAVQPVPDATPSPMPGHGMPPADGEAMQPSRPRPRLDIRPATPLGSASPAVPIGPILQPAAVAPEVGDAGAVRGSAVGDDEVAAQMQRLLGQMQAGKIPLPKIVP
jgi:hypothetical protein